jgi:hypothetical protein
MPLSFTDADSAVSISQQLSNCASLAVNLTVESDRRESSRVVSNAENSDVTMVLDNGSVKELAASPPPGGERVPVTEANRQGIVDPLSAGSPLVTAYPR